MQLLLMRKVTLPDLKIHESHIPEYVPKITESEIGLGDLTAVNNV